MKADREKTGIVFNIQKFSVNDGPGIRTVVFLKGCPLRCAWCANPESQMTREQVLWEKDKCIHCGHCVEICPEAAVKNEAKQIRIDLKRCSGCRACVAECPAQALKMEGERKSVREVLDVVMQDLPFYEESGGGLTLSGGEMLMQPDFAWNLLTAAKEEGLHTCSETTGMASSEVFTRVTEPVDELLFDLKHWNEEAHKEGTGVSNALPIANMRTAIHSGKSVLPRIPVIPGFNDSLTDAEELAKLLRTLGAKRCQLLPFHQFGENKYDLLGRDYRYRDVPALHREDLETYRQIMTQIGMDAFF